MPGKGAESSKSTAASPRDESAALNVSFRPAIAVYNRRERKAVRIETRASTQVSAPAGGALNCRHILPARYTESRAYI